MKKVVIDFETRSACDIRKHGHWAYAQHPTTEVVCCSYALSSSEFRVTHIWIAPKFRNEDTADYLKRQGFKYDKGEIPLFCKNIEKYHFVAHNAGFEYAMWKYSCPTWPEVPPIERWSDTAARGAFLGLPRDLDRMSRVLRLTTQKDLEGARLMLKLTKPRKARKAEKASYEDWEERLFWYEDAKEYNRWFLYCCTDVETERLLDQFLPELPEDELEMWQVDQKINERGIRIDREMVQKIVGFIEEYKILLNKKFSELTNHEIETASQTQKLLEWINKQGVQLDFLTAESIRTTLEGHAIPGKVRQVLQIRREIARTSTSKYEAMLNYTSSKDDRARGILMYYGAPATGRWAGRGIQPQNLPRKSPGAVDLVAAFLKNCKTVTELQILVGNPLKFFSYCVRMMLIPTEGKKFANADYSSIEARLVAWYANQKEVLNAWKDGKDIYKIAASQIYGKSYEDITKDERFVGKVAVLALGYQGAQNAFASMAKGYGVEISEKFAKYTVRKWREKNQEVVRCWKSVETAAKKAVLSQDKTQYPALSGRVFFQKRKVPVSRRDITWLMCGLPSGRVLYYFEPELNEDTQVTYMGINSYTKKWERLETYGGKLFENIVQATARDILAYAIKNLERVGYPVVTHIHDEVICEVYPDTNFQTFMDCFTTCPPFMKNFPLSGEGKLQNRYEKS